MPVTVPEELAAQTAEGSTVLFVGVGMSQPRLPGWRDLLDQMLMWAAERYVFPLVAGLRSIRASRWGRSHFRRQ
jgi:hypothetical protein